MARGVKEYKQKSIVSGLSVKQILNMDVSEFNKLGLKDLQKITGRLVSAGNKRIRRANEKKIKSPAFAYIRDHGGMFSTKGKTLNQLRAEFVRAKNFLEAETSTIKGAEKFIRDSIAALEEVGVHLEYEDFNDIMEAYESLKKSDKSVAERGLKYGVLEELQSYVDKGMDADAIKTEIYNELEAVYEKEQEEMSQDGVSGFFTIDNEGENLPPF